MLCLPALFAAKVGGNAECKALLAEQHVSAVAGVYGDDGVILRELAYIALLFIDLALAVQAAHTVVAVAKRFQHIFANAGHDGHIEHNIDGVGQLDADLGERGANRAHRIGDDIHRAALVAVAGDVIEHFIGLFRIHPVVGRAGVFFFLRADQRAGLHTGNVVDGGAVQVAIRQLRLIELNHLGR